MYRQANMWEEALRVAKVYGGVSASKQVAYAWALTLGGEEGAQLLKKMGLLDHAIEYAVESGAFAQVCGAVGSAARYWLDRSKRPGGVGIGGNPTCLTACSGAVGSGAIEPATHLDAFCHVSHHPPGVRDVPLPGQAQAARGAPQVRHVPGGRGALRGGRAGKRAGKQPGDCSRAASTYRTLPCP